MKTFKIFLIALSGILLFGACQKEFSFETGSVGGIATGTLKNLAGDCQDINVSGQYVKDSTLKGDSSYVTVQVNIATPGLYSIFTDTENGFSFKDSGYIINTGLQSIKLKASGKPLLTQLTTFTVNFASSSCSFSVNVTDTVVVKRDAEYTLADNGGACAGASVQGTYKAGTELVATDNTVSIQVNVTSAGSYTIIAGPLNGMTFSNQGTFVTTGVQTVTLKGSGTPTTAETDSIPVTAGGTSCKFGVVVGAGSGTGGGGTGGGGTIGSSNFTFTQGSTVVKGNIQGAQLTPDPLGSGGSVLVVTGSTVSNDSVFSISIQMPGTTIQNGTYTTSGDLFNLFSLSNSSGLIYSANFGTSGAVITVSITYDPTTKALTGTFSGNANNSADTAVPITAGSFTTVVQ